MRFADLLSPRRWLARYVDARIAAAEARRQDIERVANEIARRLREADARRRKDLDAVVK